MSDTKQSAEDLAILERLNLDYVEADQASDATRFSTLLAEDFVVQTPGVTRNREEFLEYIAGPRPFKDLAVHDVKVRILSDVALIHGRSTYTMLSGHLTPFPVRLLVARHPPVQGGNGPGRRLGRGVCCREVVAVGAGGGRWGASWCGPIAGS